MKILVTNDDGPTSAHSPFIAPFVQELEAKGHSCIVVLPDSQKSWIGKGFEISKEIQMKYYDPQLQSIVENETNWILMDGTPATCVNIALAHLCPFVDLVISGPNMGRNAGTGSILASGTVGAAIEAVLLGKRAISLSFAYHGIESCFENNKVELAIQTASKIIDQLCSKWDHSPEFFNVNIPLVDEYHGIQWSLVHPGGYKTLFKKNGNTFSFSPVFDLHGSQPGSDIWAIMNNRVSITPMSAKYHIEPIDLTRYSVSL